MILIKVWYRFTGLMLKWLYRIVFHGDFVYGKRFHMRRAFQLTIENGGRVVLGDDVFFNDFCGLSPEARGARVVRAEAAVPALRLQSVQDDSG